jgi:catechol 2,3-dioxygenase-like lactoylglutathione lyase family enzyme
MPAVTSLDHLVLTVANIDTTIAFYGDVLGMAAEQFQPSVGAIRWALKFGDQKINLHATESPLVPHARTPVAGSADLCFLTETPIKLWIAHFTRLGVLVEDGPIARTGATGPIMSVYVRDPDGNLIEVANRV